jgi:hypothetical protein
MTRNDVRKQALEPDQRCRGELCEVIRLLLELDDARPEP